jgi:hypothetical protein
VDRQGTKDEQPLPMLKKRDSGLPPEKWDKSSQKADISEVFFISSGRVVSASSPDHADRNADEKKRTRNAAAHEGETRC